jgi:Trk-type K+ transport system membrane component
MILIILGGLGFSVLNNIIDLRPKREEYRRRWNRLTVGTKIVLISSLVLIIGGTFTIYIFEPYVFDESLSIGEKIYHSLFLAVTTRTAGFNIAPMTELAPVVIVILLPLMWIGASPGSTGGGIKTTTFSIALLTLFNLMKGKEKVEIFKREISQDSIKKALMVILSSILFLGFSVILLIWLEPDKEAMNLIFEAVSALGTVGLSMDVTGHLGSGGKVIIISLMFIGRIGVLTFFMAFIRSKQHVQKYALPKTEIMVG